MTKSSTRPSTPWSLVCIAASEPAKSAARPTWSINSSQSVWEPLVERPGLAVFSWTISQVPSCKVNGERVERKSRLTVKPLNSRLPRRSWRGENGSNRHEEHYKECWPNSEISTNTILKSIRKKKKRSYRVLLTFPRITLLFAFVKSS